MQAVTRILAEYASATVYDDLPEAMQREAHRAFVNWVGCAFGGAGEPSVDISVAFADRYMGPRTATVVGRSERVDIFRAAFANGLSSSVHSFNDTHFATVAHPTSPVAAALFALAEDHPVSGKDFLAALILGNEIQCRVACTIAAPPAECHVGISTAGVAGVVGAAVACARALKLDATAMCGAIGLAANQSAGLREAHATMASHLTPGHSARCGLESALLAQAGFQCSETMIEGPKGYAEVWSTNPQPEAALAELGTRFEALDISYKPYPCGFVIHPVIDACLALWAQAHPAASDIERLELTGNPLLVQLTDRVHPTDRRKALVSFQHWAAVALLEGEAGIPQGGEDRLSDPAVTSVRERIVATADPSVGREAVRARLVLADGRSLAHDIEHCIGSVGRPMTDDELSAKFRAQVRMHLDADRTEGLLKRCWDVAALPSVADLAPDLAMA